MQEAEGLSDSVRAVLAFDFDDLAVAIEAGFPDTGGNGSPNKGGRGELDATEYTLGKATA